MSIIRRLILSLALMAGLAPVISFAAPPPPVPALPDTERRTSYSITSSTCACAVNFALYGDSTDVDNWIEVWISGTRYLSTDPTFGWTITSPTGPLATIPRPITDAVLTFNSAQTGTVQIVGARRPRRTTQFQENRGVAARDLNQAVTDITATLREMWDKTNDVTGRALLSQPGNTLGLLPLPSLCANEFLSFDSTGLNPVCRTGAGSGNVVGPVNSNVGDLAIFNSSTGASLVNLANPVINVQAPPYNAKGNGLSFADGATTSASTAFASSSATFTAADIGKSIVVVGVGPASCGTVHNCPLVTTISAFVDSHHVTLAASASTTASALTFFYGTDDSAAFNATVAACTFSCVIQMNPAKMFMLAGTVTLKNYVTIDGMGSVYNWGQGATLVLAQTSGPMFTIPLSGNGIKFTRFRVEGGFTHQPIIFVPTPTTAVFGSFSNIVESVGFHQTVPAISAAFSFDWVVEKNGFIQCGDGGSATASQQACVYFFNGNITGAGNSGSNTIHFRDNFVDTTYGYGFYSDSSGAGGTANGYDFITNNHFETTFGTGLNGFAAVYGGFTHASITNNLMFVGSGTGPTLVSMLNQTGTGSNIISGNQIAGTQTGCSVSIADGSDEVSGNSFAPGAGQTSYVCLSSSGANVYGNMSTTSSVAMVNDTGTFNYIGINEGSENSNPAGNGYTLSLRLNGNGLFAPLSTSSVPQSYTPVLSCASGSIGTGNTVTGFWYQWGKIVKYSVAINLGASGLGTCAGQLKVSLPTTAAQADVAGGQNPSTGKALTGAILAGTNTAGMVNYDGTFPAVNGNSVFAAGTYISQ